MTELAIAAAAYVRASAASSAAGQRAALATFAAAHSMRIHRWFQDDDAHADPQTATGAEPPARPALAALLAQADPARRDFEFVLVLDAARLERAHRGDWQSVDAELRAAGAPPLYATEPHRNDGRAVARRLKALYAAEARAGRTAAITAGKRRAAAQGFHTGAPAPFGLRRQMIGWNQEGRTMERGEGRPHGRFRSVLVHGPAGEVDTVRRIFVMYGRHGLSLAQIARRLNAEAAPGSRARPWRRNRILAMLRNEIYLGVRVMGRRARGGAGVLRLEGACEPIVSRDLYEAARERRRARRRRFTEAEILAGLRRLLQVHGVITRELVDADPELPGWITIGTRFGGIGAAMAAAGYAKPSDWEARRAMGRVRTETSN